jgi:hypothetical protein
MPTLLDGLPLPEKRELILDDCQALLNDEVSKKRGLTGLAVKAGYKMLNSIKPGAVRDAMDALLDDFLEALEPLHTEFLEASEPGIGAYLSNHKKKAADALLTVTDNRAEKSHHKALVGFYRKLRPTALRNVEEGIPGLARLLDRHYQSL